MPKISVIVPYSRGLKELDQILRDFKNQTYRDFELIIVRDGKYPQNIIDYIEKHKTHHKNVFFTNVEKDMGDMNRAPGTKPRNYGVSVASGEYVVFCDDDDRYSDRYLESLISNTQGNIIAVCQMSCQESRIYKDGDPDRTVLVPEVGLSTFPVICHVGTPCFIVKKEWALAEPWRHEPEHDFRFIKRICERFKPQVQLVPGMVIDVDGIVTKGMKDWVSLPPFYREG